MDDIPLPQKADACTVEAIPLPADNVELPTPPPEPDTTLQSQPASKPAAEAIVTQHTDPVKSNPKVGKAVSSKFMKNMLKAYKNDIAKKENVTEKASEDGDSSPSIKATLAPTKQTVKLSVSLTSTKEQLEEQYKQAEQTRTVNTLFQNFLQGKLAKIAEKRKAIEEEAEKQLDEIGSDLKKRLLEKVKNQPYMLNSDNPVNGEDPRLAGEADAQKISLGLKISDESSKLTVFHNHKQKENKELVAGGATDEDDSDGELPDSGDEKKKKESTKNAGSYNKKTGVWKEPKNKKHKRSRSRSKSKDGGRKRSHRSRSRDKKSRRSRSKSREKRRRKSRSRSRDKKSRKSRSRSRDRRSRRSRSRSRDKKSRRSRSREKKSRKSRSRSRDRKSRYSRSRSKERTSRKSRSRSRGKKSRKSRSKSRDRKPQKSRSRERKLRKSRSSSRDRNSRKKRSRSRDRKNSKSREKSPDLFWRDRPLRRRRRSPSGERPVFDKAKLRAIALANATMGMSDPSALTAYADMALEMKSGGSTVEELTKFCKQIADDDELKADEDSNDAINHPFSVKTSDIVMNIKDGRQLPVKTPMERAVDDAKLRSEFPVSSGNLHRPKEKLSEWEPVYPVKPEEKSASDINKKSSTSKLSEEDRVFPEAKPKDEVIDVGALLSEKLRAARALQDNPFDVSAQQVLAQDQISQLSADSMQPGTFTGSTGAKTLSARELQGNFPVWSKKDVMIKAAPVTTGVGKALMEKMGWKEGQGLGKHNEGSVDPLMLELKNDKKGLQTQDEHPHKSKAGVAVLRDLQGKHPISALMELCAARHWDKPEFVVTQETGPSHNREFMFKVTCNGVDYEPNMPSNNKKLAKSQAATVCLQALGLLPKDEQLSAVV